MPPLSRPSRPCRAAVGAALLLAASLAAFGPAAAGALPGGDALAASDGRDLDAALAQARIESEAAEAALDAAKRIAAPGHLLDPLPDRLMAGLGELQAEYAEMERKAAGYRATLGDQHPTLKGAEEVLAELRGQILDGARRAGAAAQQDATRARTAVASLERQARAAEATGSIAPLPPLPRPTPRPAVARQGVGDPVPSPAQALRGSIEEPRDASVSTPDRSPARWLAAALPLILRHPRLAAVMGLLAGGAALGLLAALLRSRAAAPVRIEPAASVEPVPASQRPSACGVPVLATLPVRADDDPAAVLTRLEARSDAALEQAAASVFATLAAAAGLDRVGVAVIPAAGAPAAQADAVALALAAAAASAGCRVLLVDGHPDDRIGRALARDAAVAAIVEVDGELRTVSRLTVGERVVAVLTRDAAEPVRERAPAHLPNLDGFDTIVIAGGPDGTGPVVPGLALMVAPRGAAKADLAAAARIAAGETGRPCGVLLVEPVEDAVADSVDAAPPSEPAPPRRRVVLGLRRTFEPAKQDGVGSPTPSCSSRREGEAEVRGRTHAILLRRRA